VTGRLLPGIKRISQTISTCSYQVQNRPILRPFNTFINTTPRTRTPNHPFTRSTNPSHKNQTATLTSNHQQHGQQHGQHNSPNYSHPRLAIHSHNTINHYHRHRHHQRNPLSFQHHRRRRSRRRRPRHHHRRRKRLTSRRRPQKPLPTAVQRHIGTGTEKHWPTAKTSAKQFTFFSKPAANANRSAPIPETRPEHRCLGWLGGYGSWRFVRSWTGAFFVGCHVGGSYAKVMVR
jgi:hypothetical protein